MDSARGKRRMRGADSVRSRRQENSTKAQISIEHLGTKDEIDDLMVAHQITRGLSRVSIREKKSGTSRQEKLYIKERELRQDLKDKEFQLKCIQELIFSDISNEKILDWCETHGQFVGLRVRRYRETDL